MACFHILMLAARPAAPFGENFCSELEDARMCWARLEKMRA